MAETRRKFDAEFKEGAVRIVRETGKPIAQVARDRGIHGGTLGNWVAKDRAERGEKETLTGDERARLQDLEREGRRTADGARCPQGAPRGALSYPRLGREEWIGSPPRAATPRAG